MASPFEGLRVIDLSTGIAGPFATRLLADAGADVIKVEPPEGDPLRAVKTSAILGQSPPLAEGEDGALFQWLHASKRSVVLDLETATGRQALRSLYASADCVIESFAPGWLEGAGLGFEAIQQARRQASLVSISPYGQDGPWRDRPATEFILQAETGSLAARGYPDLGPVAVGGRLGEFSAGAFAAVASLAAWWTARRCGRGQHADVSLFETMMLCFQPYQYIHGQMRAEGELSPPSVEVPSIEPARDGMVGFSTQTSQQWQDLMSLIGRGDLNQDPALSIGYERFRRSGELLPLIQAWTCERSVAEILEQASLMRIPVAPIGNGETVTQTDQMLARAFYVEHPAGFHVPGAPYRLEKGDAPRRTAAPRLGANSEEVLREARERIQERSDEQIGESGSAGKTRAADGEGGVGSVGSVWGVGDVNGAPFAGLRVIDFTAFWAGPFAATVLAGLGADVVKVESIQRPDGMRFASGFIPDDGIVWEWAPVFHGANSGKRAITLNLESEEGLALAKELVRGADVVIENFSPRVMERFGLDAEGVRALNPEAVLVRMPAFGLTGPWRDRVGFAMTIEQASGLAWVTGFPERAPAVPRGVCDPAGGMTAVFALLAALEMRRRGAGGQCVEVPLLEVGLALAGEQVVEQSAYGVRLERQGNRGPVAAPQGVYACRDPQMPKGSGWIAIAVTGDREWAALVECMGSPAWAMRSDYQTDAGRRAGADAIDAGIAGFCREREGSAMADDLTAAGIPAGLLRHSRTVVPGHPQLDARGFLVELDHPYAGRIGYPHVSFRFDGAYPPRTLPPTLGQHNDEVLSEWLGLSAEEIAALGEKGVVGTRPSFL